MTLITILTLYLSTLTSVTNRVEYQECLVCGHLIYVCYVGIVAFLEGALPINNSNRMNSIPITHARQPVPLPLHTKPPRNIIPLPTHALKSDYDVLRRRAVRVAYAEIAFPHGENDVVGEGEGPRWRYVEHVGGGAVVFPEAEEGVGGAGGGVVVEELGYQGEGAGDRVSFSRRRLKKHLVQLPHIFLPEDVLI